MAPLGGRAKAKGCSPNVAGAVRLAVIGRYRAVAEFPWFTFSGTPAWFLWLFVHIMYLAGFRNRLSVLVQWGYAFFTWQRGVRLIIRSASPKSVVQ